MRPHVSCEQREFVGLSEITYTATDRFRARKVWRGGNGMHSREGLSSRLTTFVAKPKDFETVLTG